ncbi:MAG: phosphotransferase [Ardenticatenaceae bacterium]
MLEKPNLQDNKIITALRDGYGIAVSEVDFLPLGNDSVAWVYRVCAADGTPYFLKVKKGAVYEPSLVVPRYLKDRGIEQVIAPLPTKSGQLWAKVADFTMILYPFLEGKMAAHKGMSDRQWVEFGTVLKKIHSTPLSAELLGLLPRESFKPKWGGLVRERDAFLELQNMVKNSVYNTPYERELALFWKEQAQEISKIVARAETLGRMLQNRSSVGTFSAEWVLCHADIHQFNIMLDENDQIFIVDWDETLLAPKERDLMFVGGGVGGVQDGAKEEALFFKGYGHTEIDWLALAYYRYEWVVQDMGDYAERVFLMQDIGEETKKDAVAGFVSFFEPGNVVEVAYRSEKQLGMR